MPTVEQIVSPKISPFDKRTILDLHRAGWSDERVAEFANRTPFDVRLLIQLLSAAESVDV